MGGVNLARRPFVNRRPVLRLAVLLWLIGTALLLVNLRLYSQHLQGTGDYRQRLVEVEREVREAEKKLTEQDAHLAKVNLGRQNSHTRFLNSLIDYRRFPWSALFDDLEEVLPRDVRLDSVTPAVRLKTDEVKKPRRRRQPSRRSRTRQVEAPPEVEEEVAPTADTPRSNEVRLQVSGVARTEEALMEFIDILYASPSFRNPHLPGETILDEGVSFSIEVLYLTRPNVPADEMPADETLAEPGGSEDAIEDDAPGDASAEEDLLASQGGTGDDDDVDLGAAGATLPGATLPGIASSVQAESIQQRPGSARPEPGASTSTEKESRPALPGATAGERPSRQRRGGAASRPARRQPTSPGLIGSAVPGSAVPGSAGTESGSSDPNSTQSPPAADPQPGFIDPPASATPTLRRGSLLGSPKTVLATTWGVLA